jgi:hypothetical protein
MLAGVRGRGKEKCGEVDEWPEGRYRERENGIRGCGVGGKRWDRQLYGGYKQQGVRRSWAASALAGWRAGELGGWISRRR